jgi:hypothetical protein
VHEPITPEQSVIGCKRISEALDRHVDGSARIITAPIRILLGRLHRQPNGLVVTFGELVS